MNIELKADKEKQLLYGPFLIPNKLIYRFDETNGEYYVRFSAQEIEKIATKFNEDLNSKNINLMHTDEMVDAFVAQSWVIEGDQDKSRNLGFDLPEGTWFGAVKVKDSEFWNDKIKNNEVKGFSVEILADLQLSLKNKEKIMEKQIDLGSTMLGDGTTPIYYDGDMIEVSTAIFTDEAMTMPAADDRWVLEDGRTIVVVGGMVESIEEAQVETEMADERYLAEDGPCYEGYEQVGMKMVDGKEVPNCVPVVDGKPEPSTMAIDPNTGSELPAAITPEEVSMMIDNRFGELMEEITRLKIMVEGGEKEIEEFKTQVNEKFSTTPAKPSIKKQEVKIDEKFSSMEARVKAFAKNK